MLTGALASFGWATCRVLEAVGYTPIDCDDTHGMAVMGGVSILLAAMSIAAGAAMRSLMRP